MVSNIGTIDSKLTPVHTRTVVYTAAHSGFDMNEVPLGGAAAVCAHLQQAWRQDPPFELRLLGPNVLGVHAPKHKDLVQYSELQYARFCFDFEKAITQEIMRNDPKTTVVLSNDISEGPDFRTLAERGYKIYTIYHVDVVDYFSALYLHRWIRPETAVALYDKLGSSFLQKLLPDVLKLVFAKQRDSLRYSHLIFVPSESMKRVILRCYPEVPEEKVQVLPWGSWEAPCEETAINQQTNVLRAQYQIPREAPALLTLSRISPEKGQDRLLQALKLWETDPAYPSSGVWVMICGEAAYMKGQSYRKKLEKLASSLRKTRVLFPGHVAGIQKQAHLRLAQLYVFPSRHESYGLTLLEAMRAGLPVLATHHYGAEDLVQPGFGKLLPPLDEKSVPLQLKIALQQLSADPTKLSEMGARARTFALQQSFAQTAERLAHILNQ